MDRISNGNLARAATGISDAVDYANGKRDSLPLPTQVRSDTSEAQTPAQLLRIVGEDFAAAAPALRANRDEIAKLGLETVLTPDTLCSASKRARARSILDTYKQLTLRRIELAMAVQQRASKRVYSYNGSDRDDLIRGFERSAGGNVAEMNNLKDVELSIVGSAAEVLALADEKSASIQCKGKTVYWPDEQSLTQYNKSMADIRTSATREAKINSEIESKRIALQSMAHGEPPQ